MFKGKAAYNDVVQTKDMQIAQVWLVISNYITARMAVMHVITRRSGSHKGIDSGFAW